MTERVHERLELLSSGPLWKSNLVRQTSSHAVLREFLWTTN